MSGIEDNSNSREDSRILGWWSQERVVAGYLLVLVIVALISQAMSSIPPPSEGSPIEFFTSGLLWMTSLVSLLSAFRASPRLAESVFWFALSAGLAALAIDEGLAIHERTERIGVNDDLAKIVIWIAVPLVLHRVFKLGGNRTVRNAFVAGFAWHTLYILVEIGDGEFFQLPFANERLKAAEEVLELLFLACYMFGFAVRYLASLRPAVAGSGVE